MGCRVLRWLLAQGIDAEGHMAHGNAVDSIEQHATQTGVDLIVVRRYRLPGGLRSWAGKDCAALAQRVNCSVFIATGDAD